MKRGCLLFVASVVTLSCLGQDANSALTVSMSGIDRMSMVRNSIDVPSWHEKSFWPMYEDYVGKIENLSLQTERSLYDLALTDNSLTDLEAFNNARKSLDSRKDELKVLSESYGQIGAEMNGIIALQFIQTETLMRMMKSAEIFESTTWKKFRFYANTIPSDRVMQAKRNTIANALSLNEAVANMFLAVYEEYEQECADVLGENYDIYGLYSGDASAYTPGLAKRLGYNLLDIMARENKLKEKYFYRMNQKFGAVAAARFLAWEDYSSTISKMYAWSDGL
jgi:hypothetical protein